MIDEIILHFINSEWARPFLDLPMAIMSSFDFWLPIFVAVALAALFFGGIRARTTVICVLMSIAVSDGLIAGFLKKAVNRPRPDQVERNVRMVSLAKARPRLFALVKPPSIRLRSPQAVLTAGRSFPSSHIMNNFAAAVVLAFFYRRWGWLLFVSASIVAYSRVYVGSHWPSDAVSSIPLGLASGAAALWLACTLWNAVGRRWMPQYWTVHSKLFAPVTCVSQTSSNHSRPKSNTPSEPKPN